MALDSIFTESVLMLCTVGWAALIAATTMFLSLAIIDFLKWLIGSTE